MLEKPVTEGLDEPVAQPVDRLAAVHVDQYGEKGATLIFVRTGLTRRARLTLAVGDATIYGSRLPPEPARASLSSQWATCHAAE